MNKHYLGDGAYVEYEPANAALVLTTEDGLSVTNRIVLEPGVYEALRRYIESLWRNPPTADAVREETG